MRFISITLLALFMLLLPHFASASPFWAANDTVVLQDTVYMKDLLNTANMDSVLEAILLQKLEEQGKMLARQNDSIEALHKAEMDSSYVACTTGDSTLIKRRRLLSEQYSYINKPENKAKIIEKAEKIYNIVTKNSKSKMAKFYKDLSCDFKLLEEKSAEYKV